MSTNREAIQLWLKNFHAASARLDADAWFKDFMTEDFSIQFGNFPMMSGIQNVRTLFETQFAALDKLEHRVEYFDYVPPRIYQAARIQYVVKGDDPQKDEFEVPGFAVFYVRKDGEKLKCYKAETWLDIHKVHDRMAEKGLFQQ